jgi:hypothetical protein
VPDNDILCGLLNALSVMTTLLDRKPFAVGLNVTLIVQLDLGASDAGQLLVSEKSEAFPPEIVMLLIVSAVRPGLFRVTAFGVLLVPSFCVPKFQLFTLG